MGKVIINKTDAAKTARSGSESEGQSVKTAPRDATEKVGVKMNSKNKPAEKVVVKKDTTGKLEKVEVKKSDKSTKKLEDKSSSAVVVKKATPKTDVKSEKAKVKPETGLVVRKKEIDPELALMASRSAAREKVKPQAGAANKRPDVTRMKRNGRSMSGMVVEKARPTEVKTAEIVGEKKPDAEAELRFSKVKSALIGVGVAVIVAVVGFAGIAIFGNNKKICAVNFESNGGSEVDSAEIVCGRTVAQPDDPEKEGFTFKGWVFEGDPFDFSTGIFKNATLVASWQANEGTEIVTVKFNSNGGSKVSDVEVARGKKLSRPTAPTRIGYVFDDWYLGDKVYNFNDPVNENITLIAKWIIRQTNTNTSTNNDKPSEKVFATGLSAANITVVEGKTASTTVTVVPSTAEYELVASGADEAIATCSIANNSLTCTGKGAGTTTVTVKDRLSGNVKVVTVTVEKAPVTEPPVEPDPPTPVDPDPPTPVDPDPPTPVDPDPPTPVDPDPPVNPDPPTPVDPVDPVEPVDPSPPETSETN